MDLSCLHLYYPQKISSEKTSLKQVCKCFSKTSGFPFPAGSIVCDFGGGAYDLNINEMAKKERGGVRVIVIDPFNRTRKYNEESIAYLEKYPPQFVTCNNVLNVIGEDNAMINCIENVACLAQEGIAIFTVYEGDNDGNSRPTSRGYQRHQPPKYYADIIRKTGLFKKVTLRNGFIICE